MPEQLEIAQRVEQGHLEPPVSGADRMDELMIETLESAFSQSRGRPVQVLELQRTLCEHVSSFQAQHLRLSLDTGESVAVFFKDLNPDHQIKNARKVRGGDLGPSLHELRVYQQILSQSELDTPRLYAVRWEPDSGVYWIFLEDVGKSRLRDCRNYKRWVSAARWAARFHAATRNLPQSQTSFLPVYDAEHYRSCADRVGGILTALNGADRTLLSQALEHYVSRIDWFASLPRTVIHGQFFGKNIMLRVRSRDRPIAVIDWETAALGPGGFDLVSISSGWTDDQRQAMWRAYFEEYQARTGLWRGWEDFCAELREVEIYQALERLGWWRNRSVSHNFGRWIKELTRIMTDYERAARQAAV